MALVTRQGKGSKLTSAEMDGNLTYLEGMGRPYKVYTALLTQSGTDAPVATVLENTLGGEVTWTYSEPGYYVANSNGLFTYNKTQLFHGDSRESGQFKLIEFYQDFEDENTLWLESSKTSIVNGNLTYNYLDELLKGVPVEIRVYN
jgi:hypothetical protein